MNERWNTLSAAGIVLSCFVGGSCEAAADEPPTAGKLILSAPLTHSDWVMKDNVLGVDDGLAGVRHMLDMCKAAGWSRVYWRCLDAGRSLYPSKLMDPMGPPHGDNYFNPRPEDVGKIGAQKNEAILQKMKDRYHYGTIDSLAEAVRYGHEIRLEIHAWFSINEDDHAWGWPSRYTTAHPEHRWKRRDGSVYHSQLSFAYPEVRDYKLAIIKEVLDNYPVDGIFIDWIRTGDVRDPQVDSSGVADYGYERVLVDGFKTKYGSDPQNIPNNDMRWVKYRAEPQTEFMRSLRKLTNARSSQLPVAVMVQHPWSYRGDNPKYADNLQGLLLDVATWANEGLIDAAVPAGYFAPNSGGTPELAYEHLKKLTGGKIDIWMYTWVPTTADDFRSGLERARKLGAKQILFWEADYIDNNPQKTELQKVMSDHAAMPAKPLSCVAITTGPSLAAAAEDGSFKAVEHARRTIYHSPQTPGFTSWVGAWTMPDGSLMISFTQATGPVEGRPHAPKDVQHKLTWPPAGHPNYDMTGLDLRNVHLGSTDAGKTWNQVSADAFKSCMNGVTGEAQTALADGTIVRGVWGHYLPYNPELPKTGYLQRSTDGSKTWGKPEVLLDPEEYSAWPKRIRVLRDGRLIVIGGVAHVPANSRTRAEYSGLFEPLLMVSNDRGKTWKGPIPVVPAKHRVNWGGEEFDVAELPSGDLLCVFRRADPDRGGREARWQGVLDKSADTWTPGEVGPAPFPHSGHPDLLATREGPILHVATSGIHWTRDAGKTWHPLDVPGAAYYPRAVQAVDGRILVFGHVGGDDAYGKADQSIVMDSFRLVTEPNSK